ncbi:MAG: hypothetical protein ACRD18_13555 [Terriglobia bacterium]
MARVLKWKEKIAIAVVTALISMAGVFSLKALRASGAANRPYDSQFITGPKGLGLEFSPRKPYARLVRISDAAVSLPLAVGAYVAMASATGAASPPDASGTAAPDAGAVQPDCSSGGGGGTGGGGCYTVYCSGSFEGRGGGGHTCQTCGYDTCGVCC